MARIYELIYDVMVQLPDVPEPHVTSQYVAAAREFFDTTRIWRDYDVMLFLDEFASRDGAAAFQMEAGRGLDVVDALFVEYDGKRLEKQTAKQMRRRGSGSTPQCYRVARGVGMLHIAPGGLASEESLSGEFVLIPSRDAEQLDDEMAESYGDVIELGTLYRLLRQPNREWSSPEAAMLYRAEWDNHLTRWRQRAEDDGMRGVVRRVRYGGY